MRAVRILAVLAVSFALVTPAWAAGLIDSHDVNNTQTQVNAPTTINAPVAAGGAGGAGGSAISISEGGKGGAGGSAAVIGSGNSSSKSDSLAISGSSSRSSSKSGVKDSGNSNVTIDASTGDTPYQAPAVFAPNLTAVPETCMGSISTGGSVGLQGTGVGFTFGTTWKSHDCELRMFARALAQLGPQYTPAAVALLAQNDDVKKALTDAGLTIPGQKTAAVAQPVAVASSAPAAVVVPAAVQQEKRTDSGLICSGTDLKVKAGNGEYFCRAR